jgi:galactonate dehydratase
VRRRQFFRQVFGGVGLAAGFAATRGFGAERQSEQPYTSTAPQTQGKPPQFKTKLKITKVETFLVKPRWLFLKIHTDAGIVGLGEPILEGRAKTCAAAVDEVTPYLIGKDPRNVVHHWQAIYRHAFYRGGPILTSVLSGIEQALWDIKGKHLGVPVYELLGGPTRDRVRVYAHARTPR